MSEPNQILIVEDEPRLAELLSDYLQQASFETHWLDRGDGVDKWVRANAPAAVLLDLMLPGKDGLTICREIRSHSDVPIIMVTARVEEIDRLLGLELGADDYVCKPYSPREVVARVKAVLRRVQAPGGAVEDGYRGLCVDADKFVATLSGRKLDLTPVEFRLLALLAGQPGRVYSREQLMDNIYTDGRVVSDRTVDSHVKNLRQKIADAGGADDLVRSIYGVGYKLE
ncbi:MAG: response regulator [Pseudomonadota bacterium]